MKKNKYYYYYNLHKLFVTFAVQLAAKHSENRKKQHQNTTVARCTRNQKKWLNIF